MASSKIVTKDIITLRGSAAIVSEFFGYAANSILYNRGVYPEESFAKVKKYGLPLLLTQDEGVKSFISNLNSQLSGIFDVLAYTDKEAEFPLTWVENDPKLIDNPQMVKLHSFDTKDSVPLKIRAKRGCATHPRSIAERVRRTKISERMRKLQELVPNMDKQTNTANMLDLAVDHIKDLQKQVTKFVQSVPAQTSRSYNKA